MPPMESGILAGAKVGSWGRGKALLQERGKGGMDGRACGEARERRARGRVANGRKLGFEEGKLACSLCDRGEHVFLGFGEERVIADGVDQSLPGGWVLVRDRDRRGGGGDVRQGNEMVAAVSGIIEDGRVEDGDFE